MSGGPRGPQSPGTGPTAPWRRSIRLMPYGPGCRSRSGAPRSPTCCASGGTGARDWYTLYQLREKIEAAAGGDGQIAARGWASRAKLRRFDHTANSQAILGDAARHGVQRTTPPANPMTLGEAQQLIERLIRGWVEELRASGS